jgi:ADP-ribosyl-[dinitrogen reductase] hydrolase
MLHKAQGCLVGLIAGDNLGAHGEFKYKSEVKALYPKGIKDLIPGGVHKIEAGQPTDDGEMAITLARSIILNQRFDYNHVYSSYIDWAESDPFDIGLTIGKALVHDIYDPKSASNGALMRVAPIGIYGANLDLDTVAALAIADAECTHDNNIAFETNSIFARAISLAIKSDIPQRDLFDQMVDWATIPTIRERMIEAKYNIPNNMDSYQKGYCLTALQNAMYHLYNTSSFSKAMNDTLKEGGDADTNCAIAGALLGAVYGIGAIPSQWIDSITNCKPNEKTRKPRPQHYWPNDVLDLASQLLELPKP